MDKMPIDKTARELFYDSWVSLRLAFYCFVFAIWKSLRFGFVLILELVAYCFEVVNGSIDTAIEYGMDSFYRHRQEVSVFASCFGWALSGGLIAVQLYTA